MIERVHDGSRSWHRSVLVAAVALLASMTWVGTAAAFGPPLPPVPPPNTETVTITFEDWPGTTPTPDGEAVESHYEPRGVTFSGILFTFNVKGVAGFTGVVGAASGTVELNFPEPTISSVSLFVGDCDSSCTLIAYDVDGVPIDTETIGPTGSRTQLTVTAPNIARATITSPEDEGFYLDDISFVRPLQMATGRLLVTSQAFPPGDGECRDGGVAITIGVDDDDSNSLDGDETWTTDFICNGPQGVPGVPVQFESTELTLPNEECPNGGVEIHFWVETGISSPGGQTDARHTVCNGLASAAVITPVGVNEEGCSIGGIRAHFGVDVNADGELNLPEEEQMSQVVCHGTNSWIEAVSLEGLTPSGAPPPEQPDCPTGGLRVSVGLDWDGDRELNGEEVQVEHDVCNGLNSLIVSTPIEPNSEQCDNGGFEVRSGIDRDDDGELSGEEQNNVQAICHGANAKVSSEPIDPFPEGCVNGGIRFTSWTDEDNDNNVDEGENSFSREICNGVGALAQATTLEPDPAMCATGGVQVDSGVDDNGDGALDEGEIDWTETACYGSDSIVKGTKLAEDSAVCATGGLRIDVGTDDDGDGLLESEEVNASDVVCHGESSLIHVAILNPDPAVCSTGGARIDTGHDANGNQTLEQAEVKSSRTLCNGLSSITRTSTVGRSEEQCAFGGVKIESGLDDNGNRMLDDGEVDSTQIICGGNGLAVRTRVLSNGSSECPAGGNAVESGIDSNGDGDLGDDEVQHRDVLCKPSQLLFETETIEEGDETCPHGGVRVISGHDDGEPGGSVDGELQEDEIELNREVCLAPTDVRVSGGQGSCSALPGAQGGGMSLGLLFTALAALSRRRRRAHR